MRLKLFTLLLYCIILSVLFSLDSNSTYSDGEPRNPATHLWEDGSFQVGYITGCIPFALCSE